MDDLTRYLEPTPFIDSEHPAVRRFVAEAISSATTPVERAVQLFLAVRDRIVYDPYASGLDACIFRASTTVESGHSFCVPKAILLAAAGRAVGVPTRLHFADVRNHLAGPRLLALLRTDLFVFHGYTELLLDGRWCKAAPTFDSRTCASFDVEPLEFDGHNDAILQQFDSRNRLFMEYVNDHGHHPDLPLQEMATAWRTTYPHLFSGVGNGGRLADVGASA